MLGLDIFPYFFIVFFAFLKLAYSSPQFFGETKPDNPIKGLGVPILNSGASSDDIIPNRYIVVYNQNATDDEVEEHQADVERRVKKRSLSQRSINGRALSPMVHTMKFKGWRGMCLDADDAMIMSIDSASEVAYIEADTKVTTFEIASQDEAPLGLVRLSHASVPKDPGADYIFDNSANGAGVVVYVLDTGIRTTHQEFEGRAIMGANFVNDNNTDDNGHGSHVAGTVGGATFGVAKKVDLVGVKVLDSKGQGTNSLVLQGIQYVASDVSKRGLAGKAVVNVSIGGSKSEALNSAIEAITRDGVTVVVAAGNSNKDVQDVSPASARPAITVGAIDPANDNRASFSNFGDEVDIYAPGVRVKSAGITSDTATKLLNGTSMAAPHVAGLAAYLISNENNLDTPDKVIDRIIDLAKSTNSQVNQNKRGTTPLIAYNGSGQ